MDDLPLNMVPSGCTGRSEAVSTVAEVPVKAPPIICLSAAQLGGAACARCHRPVTNAHAFVPLHGTGDLGHLGVHATLFVCWPSCGEVV